MAHLEKNTNVFLLILVLNVFLLGINNCSIPTVSYETEKADSTKFAPIFRKPNVYLYPPQKLHLSLTIDFPNGGYLIRTVPLYQNGWNISVEPDGMINGRYRFLFYEGRAPDLYQYQQGWVVVGDSLKSFFYRNLKTTGFNDDEIKDFVDYWIPILKTNKMYAIYPQYKETLDRIVRFKFSHQPDNLLRLIYVIKTYKQTFRIPQQPVVPDFHRKGFYVLEWGVVLLDETASLSEK